MKRRSRKRLRCLFGLVWVPMRGIPYNEHAIKADLSTCGVSSDDDTSFMWSAKKKKKKKNYIIGRLPTTGGCNRCMCKKPVRRGSVLQLCRYLRPSTVRILIYQPNKTRPRYTDQGRFICGVIRAILATSKRRIRPTTIHLDGLVKRMNLRRSVSLFEIMLLKTGR